MTGPARRRARRHVTGRQEGAEQLRPSRATSRRCRRKAGGCGVPAQRCESAGRASRSRSESPARSYDAM
ncbi:hypothetical protein ACFPM0_24715 [Pseudonocardia sulfidoxydans]|uniref:hypothetical protein n=1 Tax=Pseudonocardia sulfidoxydans TaxID=54011 RepID=UPI00360D37E8